MPSANLCAFAHNNRRFTRCRHGTVSRTHALRATGMRVRVHANRIPIVLGSVTLVGKKFDC